MSPSIVRNIKYSFRSHTKPISSLFDFKLWQLCVLTSAHSSVAVVPGPDDVTQHNLARFSRAAAYYIDFRNNNN